MKLHSGLAELSQSLAANVAHAAPVLAAIRLGSGQHLSAIGWPPDRIITADRSLPAQDSYSIVLPGGAVVAGFVLRRDPASNLAALTVPGTTINAGLRIAGPASVGALVLVIAANADATPNARLTAVHHLGANEIVLDSPPGSIAAGGIVLDGDGAALGLCTCDAGGSPKVAPYPALADLAGGAAPFPQPQRGWIGAALQPVTIGRHLRAAAGQSRGRLVLGLTPHGPAQRAGVEPGDILLALDGLPINGHGALRALLDAAPVGREVDVRLVRNGEIATRRLVVGAYPGV